MLYRLLADFVVLLHFLWIVFLFLGAIWGRKNGILKIFHLAGLCFALVTQIFGWCCPLTYLEVWLRSKHDPRWLYAGSFIIHYVEKIVYLELSRTLVAVGTVILVGFNVWLYLGRKKKRDSSKRSACRDRCRGQGSELTRL